MNKHKKIIVKNLGLLDFEKTFHIQKDLQNQIIKGKDEDEIVESWQNKLNIYKRMRMKYLIYN